MKRASPINVLMYALGYLKKKLSTSEKLHFLEILESYRRGRTPLCSAASILRSWVIRFKSNYLREQTFFNPFPEELMTLDDSGRVTDLSANSTCALAVSGFELSIETSPLDRMGGKCHLEHLDKPLYPNRENDGSTDKFGGETDVGYVGDPELVG